MSTAQNISVKPVAGALGAEIEGIHLGRIDDAAFAELRAAFLNHQVLFFRNQEITREEHKNCGRRFGTLQIHPFLQPLKDLGHPEFIVLRSNAKHPYVAEEWHSDVTFMDNPPLGSVLRCVVTPEFGGDPMWASMYAAYEALSDKMQHLLSDLVAIHDTTQSFTQSGYREKVGRTESAQVFSAEHPVVRTHPETMRKGLFVNSIFTTSIKGMKPAESNTLLSFLSRHIETADFTCRFRWRPNSIAIWDNRCTQHRVCGDNRTADRRMERITIEGDRPF